MKLKYVTLMIQKASLHVLHSIYCLNYLKVNLLRMYIIFNTMKDLIIINIFCLILVLKADKLIKNVVNFVFL